MVQPQGAVVPARGPAILLAQRAQVVPRPVTAVRQARPPHPLEVRDPPTLPRPQSRPLRALIHKPHRQARPRLPRAARRSLHNIQLPVQDC